MMRMRPRGVTLIEVLMVVAIMAIVLGFAVPSFSESTARRKLEGVANELATDMQYAKSQAASLSTNVSLVTTANGYSISGAASIKTVSLDTGVTLTNPITVTFEPHRSFPDAAATVNLSHPQSSATLRVRVDAVGRVLTCSPGGSFPGYPTCT